MNNWNLGRSQSRGVASSPEDPFKLELTTTNVPEFESPRRTCFFKDPFNVKDGEDIISQIVQEQYDHGSDLYDHS